MPLDVIMPALGMAQDSGVIVTWLKQPGDEVAEGDALFEVETDKATMEVEAQGKGYLTDVTAAAGEAVPVGQVIAQISDTAEGLGKTPEKAPAPKAEASSEPADMALPEGKQVIMPALGMAQDTGQLVSWLKAPGDKVGADDVLFEVETDKSTMEVPAGFDGYIAALLAEAGEDIPVGDPVAIISAEKPEAPFSQSAKAASKPAPKAEAPKTEASEPEAPKKATAKDAPAKAAQATARSDGKILASPKARRLALEQGLDLNRLVQAGHPQPFHVRDLETLKAMPAETAAPAQTGFAAPRRMTAEVSAEDFATFCDWAKKALDVSDTTGLLAGFAAASLRRDDSEIIVSVERFGTAAQYSNPDRPWLGQAKPAPTEGAATLCLRDLRRTPLTEVAMGPEDTPVLSLTQSGSMITLTLECAANQMTAQDALALLTEFAGRMEQPLRHLL